MTRRTLDCIVWLTPFCALGYALQGWIKFFLGIKGTPVWGLPRILWYTLVGTTAFLVVIMNWLERKERP